MVRFAYDTAITAQFPGVVGGVVEAYGVSNGPSSEPLRRAFADEQARARGRIGQASLAELASIAAWRRAFRAFGVDPTAYRSAAEALLRRLAKQGSIPSLATLVDIGNLVSIRYALPVAVFDLARVTGTVTVRPALGTEAFADLASGDSVAPDAGEVIFADESGLVAARRWCWRQSVDCATVPDTTDAMFVVEGHHDGAIDDVAAAIGDLEASLREHVGRVSTQTRVLTARDG
jgi:DNA/RNA-binding domain of Phe-tRNA-synthetase-like protein